MEEEEGQEWGSVMKGKNENKAGGLCHGNNVQLTEKK